MGDKSAISWTDATWNPSTGCTRVSPGCDHCYAFQLHDQRYAAWKNGKMPDAAPQHHVPFSTVQLFPERLDLPLRWKKPRRIFVDSMADLFHEDVPDSFIAQVWRVMGDAHWHTFQILTKRPERMKSFLAKYEMLRQLAIGRLELNREGVMAPFPLPNVWLGVSVEDQQRADERIPLLLQTPAAVRFISAEPLLGPVELVPGLDWVIVGGESGTHRRDMDIEWARSIRDQCVEDGTAFFFKQSSALRPGQGTELDGQKWHEFPQMVVAL